MGDTNCTASTTSPQSCIMKTMSNSNAQSPKSLVSGAGVPVPFGGADKVAACVSGMLRTEALS